MTKQDIKGSSCMLRSPNASNANNVRIVYPTGNINNNNAYNTNGVAPDCENSQHVVTVDAANPVHSRKERLSCPDYSDENISADASVSKSDTSATNGATTVRDIVCSFENLYKAAHVCKKNVMWKDSVAGYMKNILINTVKLKDELLSDTYKISPYSIFTIHERKTRIIVSTRFRDRVFQRSLCDNYLTEKITKSFIFDNCACQKEKGTDMSGKRLAHHMKKFYRSHGLNGYVLKMDIKDYFGSTPHDVAKAAVRKRVDDEWALYHVNKIIDSFTHISPDKGMGLGSQITQLVQLAVLDDIDHFIKEELRIKHYVRYMDDLVLMHHEKEHLLYCKNEIKKKFSELNLQESKKKTYIQRIDKGISYLGFVYRLTETGKVIKTMQKPKIGRERRKLKRLVSYSSKGFISMSKVDQCYDSWKSHAEKGNCKGMLKNMDSYYLNLCKEVENVQAQKTCQSNSRRKEEKSGAPKRGKQTAGKH